MSERTFITGDPYQDRDADKSWNQRGVWPCRWIAGAGAGEPPFVFAYRVCFELAQAATIRVHVSADERYELFLDGRRVGRGSERGDVDNWFFETYDLVLEPGAHRIVARVWSLGAQAPYAQMSLCPGFLLSPQEDAFVALIGTGVAGWQAKKLAGTTFTSPLAAWGTGANVVIDGSQFPWGFEQGQGDDWGPVVALHEGASARRNDSGPVHRLQPATLPPMLEAARTVGVVRLVAPLASIETHNIPIRAADHLPDEAANWQQLLNNAGAVTIAPHTRRRVLVDLQNYYCAFPEVVTSGGANSLVRVHWQESLYQEPEAKTKGNRDEVENKYFVTVWPLKDGVGDMFRPDGGARRRFDTLWWQCGRFVEIVIETTDEPLMLSAFVLRETRYPLENESAFDASDDRLARVIPLTIRALQMCAHETYMDCPFYEQLMYAGDTRLEALATFVVTRDDRLPRKALRLFDVSRVNSGLTQSRYPSRVRQVIPPFSLWWVAMVYDYARWRDDPAFVQSLMPGVRAVVDHFAALRGENGLVQAPDGWNYMDWVPAWKAGIPPDGHDAPSGLINAQFALVLTQVAQLEAFVGEPELAARAERLGRELATSFAAAFWDEGRALFADDRAKRHFSEHTQCLALLGGHLDAARQDQVLHGLLHADDLARTTIYFTHYLFETLYALNRPDVLLERLALWFDLEPRGLKTTVEMPEPTRSDCHAWGAHPLYHYFASILGIRPAAFGFREVQIRPQLGALTWATGTLPHPRGAIVVDLRSSDTGLQGTIVLPPGVHGTFQHNGRSRPLHPGKQEVTGGEP